MNSFFSQENLMMFINRAMNLFNVDEHDPCEKPLLWPTTIPPTARKHPYIDNWTQVVQVGWLSVEL
jgi:hypothetical protein